MLRNTKKGAGNKTGHTVTPFENHLFRPSEQGALFESLQFREDKLEKGHKDDQTQGEAWTWEEMKESVGSEEVAWWGEQR